MKTQVCSSFSGYSALRRRSAIGGVALLLIAFPPVALLLICAKPCASAGPEKHGVELIYSRNFCRPIGVYIQDGHAKIVGGFSTWSMILAPPDRVLLFSKDNGTYNDSSIKQTVHYHDRVNRTTNDTIGPTRGLQWSKWRQCGSGKLLGMNATKWVRTGVPNPADGPIKATAGVIKSASDECWTTADYTISPTFRLLLCSLVRTSPPTGIPIKFNVNTTFTDGKVDRSPVSYVAKKRAVDLSASDFSMPAGLKVVKDFYQVIMNREDREMFYQVRVPDT